MNTPRKIAVITTSRADYGLLYWLMCEIKIDPELQLQIIVSGMHLSPEFDFSYKQIEIDGFYIDEKVEILFSSDSKVGVAKTMGAATLAFADTFNRLKPDMVVILGDRCEMLAIAQTAMVLKIPIAHIHGGETTEGAIDDSIRHAITKLAHIHFPAAEVYRERVLQLGEAPKRVFNFGAPGLDHITRTQFLDKGVLGKELNIEFRAFNILITYHPVTAMEGDVAKGLGIIFDTLDKYEDTCMIFTKSNADESGRLIGKRIDGYINNKPNMYAFTALGIKKYLSLAKVVDVVLGNSSSGLIEVPFVGTPTINIGDRQKGRLSASSVISCDETVESVEGAIQCSQSKKFQESLKSVTSPYGKGDASKKIKETLKKIDLKNIIRKKFHEYKQENIHYS